MKTTTVTTVTGSENILKGTISINYWVELERKNNEASLFLWTKIGGENKILSSAYGTSFMDDDKKTFEESLECALQIANEKWNIEVKLKEVA